MHSDSFRKLPDYNEWDGACREANAPLCYESRKPLAGCDIDFKFVEMTRTTHQGVNLNEFFEAIRSGDPALLLVQDTQETRLVTGWVLVPVLGRRVDGDGLAMDYDAIENGEKLLRPSLPRNVKHCPVCNSRYYRRSSCGPAEIAVLMMAT